MPQRIDDTSPIDDAMLHCDESTSEGPTRSVEEDHSEDHCVEEASVEDAIGEEARQHDPLKAPLIRHVES